jgi:RNA polymerase sigma-70 factor, ECF subfamily
VPGAAETASAFGLLIRHGDGALGVVVQEKTLRRSASLGVAVGATEASAQLRLDDLGRKGVHILRLGLVKPLGRRARPIERPFRPEGPLVYAKLSDPILVRRAKDGDARALEALCERHAPRVEKLAARILRDPEDARDAAQESLAKLCVRIRQFRGDAQFATWLHRLVVNTCHDVANRQRLRACEPLHEDRRRATDGDPARAADLAELRSELGAGLAELAPAQARVVALKDALDFSFEEISAATGMPVGTAKCYAHRGRNRLRDTLTDVA